MDERIARGRREIARDDEVRRGVGRGRRCGRVRGHVPAHFVEAGIFGGHVGLVRALTVDIDEIAGNGIGGGPGRGGRHRLGQRQRDVAAGIGRPGIVNHGDLVAATEVGPIHHQVIAHLRMKSGRAVHNDGLLGHVAAARHLGRGPNHDAIGQAREALGRGAVAAGVLRTHGGGRGHGHRDLAIEVLLKEARGRDCVASQHVLPHHFRGHHGDQCHREQQHARNGQCHQDFNQRETALAAGANGRL